MHARKTYFLYVRIIFFEFYPALKIPYHILKDRERERERDARGGRRGIVSLSFLSIFAFAYHQQLCCWSMASINFSLTDGAINCAEGRQSIRHWTTSSWATDLEKWLVGWVSVSFLLTCLLMMNQNFWWALWNFVAVTSWIVASKTASLQSRQYRQSSNYNTE